MMRYQDVKSPHRETLGVVGRAIYTQPKEPDAPAYLLIAARTPCGYLYAEELVADLGGLLASFGVWQQAAAPQDCAHVAVLLRCFPLDLLPLLHLYRISIFSSAT